MEDTVMLAYSGGLDTSVQLKLIQQKYDADMVTVTINVGQQKDMSAIVEKDKKWLMLTERDRNVIAF